MSLILVAEARGVRAALHTWSDSLTLWRHAVAVAPRSTEAHNGLATALQARADYAASIQEHRLALSLGPSPPTRQLNFGILLSRLGQHEEAIQQLRSACARMPNNVVALHQFAIALARAGRLEEAESLLRRELSIRPQDVQAQTMLGLMRMVRGYHADGIEILRRVVAHAPEDAQPQYNLATALIRVPGHHDEVVELLRQAIRHKSDWVEPQRVLAWLQATNPDPALRDPAEALQLADRAVELSGGRDADALDAQAAANAALGRFDQAVTCARKALAAAQDSTAGVRAGRIRERLALYERRVPYTEPTGSDSTLTLR
jgi:tetratricopeptide (TPR) repeat protein